MSADGRSAALRNHSAAKQNQAQQGHHPMTDATGSATAVVAPTRLELLGQAISRAFPDAVTAVAGRTGELTYEVASDRLLEVATAMRDRDELKFEMCMDVCGVDY